MTVPVDLSSGDDDSPHETAAGGSIEVLAIASSAGGVSALRTLLGALPADLPIPVVVVQHLDPHHATMLAQVIGRDTPLRVKLAEADEPIKAGTVYVAPPDRHLLVASGGTLRLTQSAQVHFVRPSADLLFQSLAEAYGPGVVACVLTGTGRDGADGVRAVKAHGGTVIVQDPASAEFNSMPTAAAASTQADLVLPLEEIAGAAVRLLEAGSPG